jgi:hypothetical protein
MFLRILSLNTIVLMFMVAGCQKLNDSNASLGQLNKGTVNSDKPTVTAYYFHRTIRCPTCMEIEANTAKVIENNFSQQLADKRLMWMPFNLDELGGEKFEKEFDISTSTLVLVKTRSGNHTEYKKLGKVWQLVHDPDAFDTYVRNEVKQFLNEQLTN